MEPQEPIETPWENSPALALLDDLARDYLRKSRSEATRQAYRRAWADFELWCDERKLLALPALPETVALYLADRAQRWKPATLAQRVVALSQAHQAKGHESPTTTPLVRKVLAGIRRDQGTAQDRKAPLVTVDLKDVLRKLPLGLLGLRDRALLLVGFAGAFRRSELVAFERKDLEWVEEGVVFTIRRSKTDQEGAGRRVGITRGRHPETCPVQSLRSWLEAAQISVGPIFRAVNRHGHVSPRGLSDRAVALIVKRAMESLGLDPERFAGHSLRAGHATTAANAGVPDRAIMNQTGHRSRATLDRYVRDGRIFKENSSAFLGL